MTRIIRIELCDECRHAFGTRACKLTPVSDGEKFTIIVNGGFYECRRFDSYPLIPGWCPLEQDGPDWRPPVTIDLNGPPRYSRGTTDAGDHAPCLRYADRGGEPHAAD